MDKSLPLVMRRFLTEGEQQRLLKAARSSSCPLAQRDYWWMRLMLNTGARVDEFARLGRAQAEHALASGWLVVSADQRKGKKRGHEYAVTASVREALQQLLTLQASHRPAELSGAAAEREPLVWGRDGQALSVRSYQARLKHWVQVANLPEGTSPHWLRHSRGVNIVRRSGAANPLKVVQAALGHADISSSAVYTQIGRDELAATLQRVDGQRMSRRAAVATAAQGGAL